MPRHLEALAWTGTWIGILYGARKVVESVAMWAWASVADGSGQTVKWLRVQFLLGTLCLYPLLWLENPYWIALSILGFGVCQGGALPLLDTLSIQQVGASQFGRVRLWGSAGFLCLALVSAGIGWWGDYQNLASAVPWLIVGFATLACLGTFWLQEPATEATKPKQRPRVGIQGILDVIAIKPIAFLLLLSCLHWTTQAPFNLFIVALFEEKKMPAWAPGASVALGVFFEVMVMSRSSRWIQRASPNRLLALAALLGGVRWLITAHSTSLWLVIAIQALHGISFGLYFATTVATLHEGIAKNKQAQAQAVLYLIMFGLGSLIGNALAGVGFEHLGAGAIFMASGVVELILFPLLLFLPFQRKSS